MSPRGCARPRAAEHRGSVRESDYVAREPDSRITPHPRLGRRRDGNGTALCAAGGVQREHGACRFRGSDRRHGVDGIDRRNRLRERLSLTTAATITATITGVTISATSPAQPVVKFQLVNESGEPLSGLTAAEIGFAVAKLVPAGTPLAAVPPQTAAAAPLVSSQWQSYIYTTATPASSSVGTAMQPVSAPSPSRRPPSRPAPRESWSITATARISTPSRRISLRTRPSPTSRPSPTGWVSRSAASPIPRAPPSSRTARSIPSSPHRRHHGHHPVRHRR